MKSLKFLAVLIVMCSAHFSLKAQVVPSPASYLGYTIGTRFTRHHNIVSYFNTIAQTLPDRVKIINYGKTNEGRDNIIRIIMASDRNLGSTCFTGN